MYGQSSRLQTKDCPFLYNTIKYIHNTMIYRYIYKITCTAGSFKGKFYFGQHTTNNLNDGYKGSGVKIIKYLKKHPNDYIKEIIAFYNTQEELNQAEYDIILPWLNNKMCLNLKEGGGNNKLSNESKKKISKNRKGIPTSKETRKKMSNSHNGQIPWNKGIPCSEKTKQRCREATSRKRWLTRNNEKPIYVDIDDVDYYLSLGYHFGRK